MFALTDQPIQVHPAYRTPGSVRCGALVEFAGHVREQNQGRQVVTLQYEGASALAANEFQRIEAEVLDRYAIDAVSCIHRVGILAIGDAAVWIGVWAPHRGPAFDACRYVIDELKKRLPIWKKEHYADGDSGWINNP